jgi:excinuclease UvrABC ATPase subunit
MGSPFGNIEVRGARENNLKNISLEIPRRQITVFTGVSGSGKSSLVFDTIAAESQRLLNETFSTFAQNFLPRYGHEGLGRVSQIDIDALVDKNKSFEEGAILFPTFDVGGYHWLIFAQSGFFDV